MKIYFDVDDGEVQFLLENARQRCLLGGLRPFFAAADRFLNERIEDRFRNHGDELTGPWPALAWNTVMIRRRLGYGGERPINVRTGALQNYVETSRVAGDTLTKPDPFSSKELQSKLRVAQEGGYPSRGGGPTRGPNRPAPPRPVIGLGAVDELAIRSMLARYITDGVT